MKAFKREQREVFSGRLLPDERIRRLSIGNHALITAYICDSDCTCDGYEVGLTLASVTAQGGMMRGPIWPFLSARTEDEAKAISTELRAAAREAVRDLTRFRGHIVPAGDSYDTRFEALTKAARAVAAAHGFTSRVASGALFGPVREVTS